MISSLVNISISIDSDQSTYKYPTFQVTICCIDADDYTKLPIGQYEEDNILRELNKCLLGFQQKQTRNNENQNTNAQSSFIHRRRLSPIGESMGKYKCVQCFIFKKSFYLQFTAAQLVLGAGISRTYKICWDFSLLEK